MGGIHNYAQVKMKSSAAAFQPAIRPAAEPSLCREHSNTEGWRPPPAAGTQNKRQLLSQLPFVLEHRNTIDAMAFAHSQATGILFFTPQETVLRYELPEFQCGDPVSKSPSG